MPPPEDAPPQAAAGPGDRVRAAGRGAARAAAASGRGARRAGAWSARGARRAAVATGTAAGFTFRQTRRATRAEGAGQSGLSRLIELHAFNAAGDAAVAISLAGTLFFQVPTDQARGQVALFLGLTMLPFAIVAPLIGPFLDRFRHGRRWAIGATMAIRAASSAGCWPTPWPTESPALFLAALGVPGRVEGVRRHPCRRRAPAAAPSSSAWSRPTPGSRWPAWPARPSRRRWRSARRTFGAEWSLRYAFAVFVVGTILAILLPARVDNPAGDREPGMAGGRRPRPGVPRTVVLGLRSNAGLRLLSGFLTMFMAFLLRYEPFPGWEDRTGLLLGLVDRRRRPGQHHRHRPGLGAAQRQTRGHRRGRPGRRRGRGDGRRRLFYGLPTAVLLGLTAGLASRSASSPSTR